MVNATRSAVVELWWDDLDAAFSAGWDARELLDVEERTRAERFVRARDRRRFVTRRGLLRCLLGEKLGLAPQDVPLEAAPHGKPFCPLDLGLSFSCSSSGPIALFGIARDCRLGVDVEHRPEATWEPLPVRRYLSEAEFADLQRAPGHVRRRREIEAWVAKEAIAKAIGTGLRHSLTDIVLSGEPDDRVVRLDAEWSAHASSDWTVRNIDVGDHGSVGAVAADRPARVADVRRVPEFPAYSRDFSSLQPG